MLLTEVTPINLSKNVPNSFIFVCLYLGLVYLERLHSRNYWLKVILTITALFSNVCSISNERESVRSKFFANMLGENF